MTREIPLTKGFVALVDDADFDWLSQWGWRTLAARNGRSYAARSEKVNGKWRTFYMHRVITGAAAGADVDHQNYDGLDNRRSNLRVTTRALNIRAKRSRGSGSGFRGVYRRGASWTARLMLPHHGNGPRKEVYLGTHRSALDAARAYDTAALERFGEFAVLNFPAEHL